MDAFGITVSMALQWGVPLDAMANKLSFARFEPAGETDNPLLPDACSIVDYIARWLGSMLLPSGEQDSENKRTATPGDSDAHPAFQVKTMQKVENDDEASSGVETRRLDEQFANFQSDAPPCSDCGSITVHNGNCYHCFNCGSSQGCS